MKKLSIIVPAFKVEEYIAGCLESLLDQGLDLDDYEIIVVNDGSPDRSKDIADSFAERYPNIIVCDQENQGVSVARNRGLDVASGEYVAFVDPDDSLHRGALKQVLERADEEDLDLLYLSLEVHDETGKILEIMPPNGRDHEILDGFSHPRRTFLSTLYRRDLIGTKRFTQGITRGQDTVFNAMVQTGAARCSYCSLPYYRYLQRETSSRQFVGSERTFISSLLAIETLNNFQKTNFPVPNTKQREYFDAVMLIFVERILQWIVFPQKNSNTFSRLKKRLRELGLERLIVRMSEKYRFFDQPFLVFAGYLKLSYLMRRMMNK